MSLQQVYIAGSALGLRTDIKPFLLPEQAFSTLDNAYVWREQVKKKEGSEYFGRLRRQLMAVAATAINWTTDPETFNLFTLLTLLATEPNAQIQPGTLASPIIIVIGAQTLTDSTGDGIFSIAGVGTITAAEINYANGNITLHGAPGGILAVTVTMNYYPSLPVMGIWVREIAGVNNEQTIFFDTKYAYINPSGLDDSFIEFQTAPMNPWDGNDANFFWATNYRGITDDLRLFFVTNFFNSATVPIRYYDNSTSAWVDFRPQLDGTNFLNQAKIILPFFGRLLALNTIEGAAAGAGSNFFNRCRFSQIGDPTAIDAWRSDQFGKGGFIDAPTNEEIISAAYYKNTLIVGFEKSTWQLRWVGEYGLPFLWERISSDFGCDSQFSTILFDQGVLQVGDKAIVSSNAVTVNRIDEQIPDTVFSFKNDTDGNTRVQGIRNFQKELVYWCYLDTDLEPIAGTYRYPNRTLLFNYRNKTYAKFRNNVTAFGTYQSPIGITWDRTDIFWDDETVFWDNNTDNPRFPSIVSGNQQGYIHFYCNSSIEEKSLSIYAIDYTTSPVQLTIPNHNFANNEWIQVKGALFNPIDPVASEINERIFIISVIDENTISLSYWNGSSAVNYSNSSTSTYIGSGEVVLFTKIDVQTKDFNPYQAQGSQLKISYIDFLFDAFPQGIITVNLLINSAQAVIGNMIVGNKQVESALTYFGSITNASQSNPCVITSANHNVRTGNTVYISDILGMTQLNNNTYTATYIDVNSFSINVDSTAFSPYVLAGNWEIQNESLYILGSQYSWHRFFATSTGQFIRIQLTYDNSLMANIATHRTNWIMNAISLWVRPGSRNVF